MTVNAVHPGIVDTDIVRHMSFTQSTFASVFLMPLAWPFIKTPKQGAQTTLFAALDPSFDTVTGQYLRYQNQRLFICLLGFDLRAEIIFFLAVTAA